MNESKTTNYQLLHLYKKFGIKIRDICSKDKFNDNQPCKGAYIINMQDSTDGNGTHWYLVYLEKPKKCAYFDSFGIINLLVIEEFAKRFGCQKY